VCLVSTEGQDKNPEIAVLVYNDLGYRSSVIQITLCYVNTKKQPHVHAPVIAFYFRKDTATCYYLCHLPHSKYCFCLSIDEGSSASERAVKTLEWHSKRKQFMSGTAVT
jgi:hypothetical protein